MAKKSVEGQLDMFELFGSVEELEENVKGMSELQEKPVMQRGFVDTLQNKTAVIAYINYNKVYLKDWSDKPIIYQFDSAKESVDFYVEQMERFLAEKHVMQMEKTVPLQDAVTIKWTGDKSS